MVDRMTPDTLKALAAELRDKSCGKTVWRIMNKAEDGYSMEFEWNKREADEWLSTEPRLIEAGYHVVECVVQTELKKLSTQAAAILEQIAAADAGVPVVCYGVELPGGGFHAFRKGIDDAQRRVDVCNERRPRPPLAFVSTLIRQADHLAALTAQSGEGVALYEALKEIAGDYADRFDLDSPSTNPGIKSSIKQARAAIAAYEAKRGGVR